MQREEDSGLDDLSPNDASVRGGTGAVYVTDNAGPCVISSGGHVLQNVAFNKTSWMSSTNSLGGLASSAVDGVVNTIWTAGNTGCSQTASSVTNPYLAVDLLGIHTVYRVKLFGRLDCCMTLFAPLDVRFGWSNSTFTENAVIASVTQTEYNTNPTNVFDLVLSNPVTGRYLFIVAPGTQRTLTLCEVQAFGISENIALLRPSWQSFNSNQKSSNSLTPGSALAVDGNTNPRLSGGSCIDLPPNLGPYWGVDLLSTTLISSIVLFNREEIPERLPPFEIRFGEDKEVVANNPVIVSINSSLIVLPVYSFNFANNRPTGQFLFVVAPGLGRMLSFCEIFVF